MSDSRYEGSVMVMGAADVGDGNRGGRSRMAMVFVLSLGKSALGLHSSLVAVPSSVARIGRG